ncbi:MAG: bifunctional acetate--CoA ligase family protein/GNAT family N-acetyltransferase [Alphaproteobacteria bacterium]|nr:bifunctional acetate--CoA ligase family protein/GNAT family N-acetyltransferase [Alphaproteobacteria bacterium]
MSTRNLSCVFQPKSVALVGASDRSGSVGEILIRNLVSAGFAGPIMPVNPAHKTIHGLATATDVAHLPITPDLAVIATPPPTVPGIIADLGHIGCKAAVIITAGFGEGSDQAGVDLRQRVLDAARPHLLRIVGPNCLGVMTPNHKLNATFAHLPAPAGDLAFVAQSGAIIASMLDWAVARGIGFSHVVSLGDMTDVDFGDMLDYLAGDAATKAILLYIEGVTAARKFMSAARIAARMKPVLVVKSGRRPEGAKVATSHTGALAGVDAVYDAAFRRAGILRVFELDELFDAAATLALCGPLEGERLAILTNGGGLAVMATDTLMEMGGTLAPLAPETIAALDRVLPRTWSRGNPVDIIGDATPRRYGDALATLLEDRAVDAVLALNAPTALASSADAARAVAAVAAKNGRKVLTSWVGESTAAEARQIFAAARMPTYPTPNEAVRGFMHLVRYRTNQALLSQLPAAVAADFTPDRPRAAGIIAHALAENRPWLSGSESKEILAAYAVPVVRTQTATTPDAVEAAARAFDTPCAVKILSPDIPHKTDVGGVVLNLADPQAAKAAAAAMLDRVRRIRPDAKLAGFTVEPMVERQGAYELLLGMTDDSQFGPVMLFGQGGIAAEIIGDRALALAPLNLALARSLMERTKIFRQLRGFRNQPSAALDAIALTLVKLSQLIIDCPEIAEFDINPLLAGVDRIIALDARIRVKPAKGDPAARFAIRPYPTALVEAVTLESGETCLLRPMRPEDASAIEVFFRRLSSEDVRLRFFAPLTQLSPTLLARLTQLDYEREMALLLSSAGAPESAPDIYGVVRLSADPNNENAEFAITVRSDLKGHGIGRLLMKHLITYARSRMLRVLQGDVLRENRMMLELCRELGFAAKSLPEDADIMRVTLPLAQV